MVAYMAWSQLFSSGWRTRLSSPVPQARGDVERSLFNSTTSAEGPAARCNVSHFELTCRYVGTFLYVIHVGLCGVPILGHRRGHPGSGARPTADPTLAGGL